MPLLEKRFETTLYRRKSEEKRMKTLKELLNSFSWAILLTEFFLKKQKDDRKYLENPFLEPNAKIQHKTRHKL